jgi:hypothetical protein
VTNDMTWEQKCRISALRAACASQFTIFGVPTHLTMPPDTEADEHMTKRILERAEAFRIALLSDGALNYMPSDDETSELQGIKNCVRCLKAISFYDEGNRWFDKTGSALCDSKGILMHTPVEPIGSHCPWCGSSRKKTALMVNDGMGDSLQCNHKWHQE